MQMRCCTVIIRHPLFKGLWDQIPSYTLHIHNRNEIEKFISRIFTFIKYISMPISSVYVITLLLHHSQIIECLIIFLMIYTCVWNNLFPIYFAGKYENTVTLLIFLWFWVEQNHLYKRLLENICDNVTFDLLFTCSSHYFLCV